MRGKVLAVLTALCIASAVARSQDVQLGAIDPDSPSLDETMRNLAQRALSAPDNADAAERLANRVPLELATRQYRQALTDLDALRKLRPAAETGNAAAPSIAFRIYAAAKARQLSRGESFASAYIASYPQTLAPFDNRIAFDVSWFLGRLPVVNERFFRRTLQQYNAASKLSVAQTASLLRDYVWWRASLEFSPVLHDATDADDARRYVVDQDVRVRTADGATVTAILVRPRAGSRQTTLLNFSIYARLNSLDEARRTASYGYAGVLGFSRGKYHSRDAAIPWEHDGDDARALIQWIAGQRWSDGRVGMYGGSYNGFVQWSVAKHLPSAVKAMMPSVPTDPGVSGPMEGNIFPSYQYRFVPYVTKGSMLDEQGNDDMAHWRALDKAWYVSGRAYRDLDVIDGTPNPLYRRLLDHPSYDDYWKRLMPQGEEFARINIPVLATAGYYEGGQLGARRLFEDHHRYNPNADHTIVLGPYSHGGAQNQSEPVVDGYEVDPAATLDVWALRYAWFDHIFKGKPRPELLKNAVNYEVSGANVWRHVASFDAMSDSTLQLYLTNTGSGRSLAASPSSGTSTDLVVDLADRSDVDWLPPTSNVLSSLDTHNALAFVSEPLPRDTEVTGILRLMLDVECNKKDMDLVVRVYEQRASGDYLQLSMPYMQRVSYLRDRSRRQLLQPGTRTLLRLEYPGPLARLVKAGGRLVVLLGVQKQRDAQINYGTGKDVSDETMADAGEPLRVRVFGSSYATFPIASSH